MTRKFEVKQRIREDLANASVYYDLESVGIICPNCKAIASQKLKFGLGGNISSPVVHLDQKIATLIIVKAFCNACHKDSYWLENFDNQNSEMLLYPKINSEAPSPNSDMPENIRQIFSEASLVLSDSPRASAALSRLAIDELTKELDPNGSNLNKRIGNLVGKGLPIQVQQSLDIVRVVGNNAVHPGEIDLTDNKEIALSLLQLINVIVENRISQPKQIQSIYESLPSGALEAIERRDSSPDSASN